MYNQTSALTFFLLEFYEQMKIKNWIKKIIVNDFVLTVNKHDCVSVVIKEKMMFIDVSKYSLNTRTVSSIYRELVLILNRSFQRSFSSFLSFDQRRHWWVKLNILTVMLSVVIS
jgi:hypothetical protein